MNDDFDLLLRARIIRDAHLTRPDGHLTVDLGDQTGLLDPTATEPLVARLSDLLPSERVAGVAVGGGIADVLLGYLLARARGVPLASVANIDGMIEVGGQLAQAPDTWLVVTVLDEAETIAEFDAACRRSGASAGGVVALIDRMRHSDKRVGSLIRWSTYLYEPEACPVCRGGT